MNEPQKDVIEGRESEIRSEARRRAKKLETGPRSSGYKTRKSIWGRWNSKIRKSQGCWEWQGIKNKKGYGVMYIGFDKMEYAHRLAYWFFSGMPERGMLVCHHCDNPSCVNPDHLFISTYKGNAEDCVRKGRQHRPPPEAGRAMTTKRIGSATGNALLTEEQVLEIRSTPNYRGIGIALAKKFGVDPETIRNLRRWVGWFSYCKHTNRINREDGLIHCHDCDRIFAPGFMKFSIEK